MTYIIYDIISDCFSPCPCAAMQVAFVNDAIRKAPQGSGLHGLAPIADPSDEIIEVLLAALRWDVQERRFGLTAVGLEKLHALSVELLEVPKENMPYRTGGPEGWNFEKAHSILHKVRRCVIFFCLDGLRTSVTRALNMGTLINARHCKRLANCTNNKEVYLTVLRAHSREGHLQYLRSLEVDLADAAQEEDDGAEESVSASTVDKECEAGACELGIRYPTLQSIYAGKLNKHGIQVYIIYDIILCNMISYFISCMIYIGAGKKNLCRNSKKRCLPSLCWQGMLGCASSQASPLGCPSRATRCRLCR
jgi:hypothetical protein